MQQRKKDGNLNLFLIYKLIYLNNIVTNFNISVYSIDNNRNCYKLNSKNTGFLVKEKFPNLINKWELHTGGYTSEFIENIGYNIDLVYIDTVHYIPGEMFNWLEISPLLKEETFVVLHDTFFIYKKNSTKIVNYSNI